MDIHTSGHGWAEDHKLMLNLIKPEYFLPYYLNAYFRYEHRKLGLAVGIEDERILMPHENGSIIEMYDGGCKISTEKLDLDAILIDGKGKGHLSGEYVIKARQIMAHDGIVNLIFKIDSGNKDIVGNIQIESRGFVYSSEVRKVHTKVVDFARATYNKAKKKKREMKDIMKILRDDLGEYIKKEVGREPMIVPMYVYITKNGSLPTAGSKTWGTRRAPTRTKPTTAPKKLTTPVAKVAPPKETVVTEDVDIAEATLEAQGWGGE